MGHKILRALDTITRATTEIGQGNFTALAVPATDDETRRVVEAFNHMIRELERRQGQLLQERKMSSLGVLTSGIAHQLNNPLNNISTSCQILMEEMGEGATRPLPRACWATSTRRSAGPGTSSRAFWSSPGPRTSAPSPPTWPRWRPGPCAWCPARFPRAWRWPGDIPDDLVLEMDAGRMQEVFINLFINALQALPDSGGRIKISARADAQAGQAVIAVEDTGPGIPAQDLGRVFDPFFTTKEVGKGTGLGLSIVFGIIERHQGAIAAEDTGGAGARLVIRLPLPAQPAQTAREPEAGQ